jgi:hypothetical protein
MPDCPPILRGRLYNTARTFRCPNYSKCHACGMCDNYSPNTNSMCAYCEGAKNTHCTHSDAVQYGVIMIERIFKKPMSHPDEKLGTIESASMDQVELQAMEQAISDMGIGVNQVTKIRNS